MVTIYRSPLLEQFRDRQIRYAPREAKLDQVNRAEQLLREIEPGQDYTFDYLHARITGFKPQTEQASRERISGEVARRDLRRFVEDLSSEVDLTTADVAERVLTVEDVAKSFNVSTKTVARWREQGLVSRRFVIDGRKRVGFLKSSVDEFVAQNPDRIERGERFSHLTDEEKAEILRRARIFAGQGQAPTPVAKRLAEQFGRSVETIRYVLKQYDEANPETAIFVDRMAPLSQDAREDLYRRYRAGDSVEELAERYGRTRTSVYRVVNEVRLAIIRNLPLDCVHNTLFDEKDADKIILADGPDEVSKGRSRMPSGLPPYLASLYDVPLLTKEQEAHLFRKMNFLKYRASELRKHFDETQPRTSVMEEIESLYNRAVEVKNQIVQANLRLVVSIAKRHVSPMNDLFSLISDGNISLIKAVEKFDYSRGFKFSTYASWAIMKNFARTIPDEFKQHDRFRTTGEEIFLAQPDRRSDPLEQEVVHRQRRQQIARILGKLDDRERQIIRNRFGLDDSTEPLTLKQVGEAMGVTKERVRQIEARALSKLRAAAAEEAIDEPEQ